MCFQLNVLQSFLNDFFLLYTPFLVRLAYLKKKNHTNGGNGIGLIRWIHGWIQRSIGWMDGLRTILDYGKQRECHSMRDFSDYEANVAAPVVARDLDHVHWHKEVPYMKGF